jgi:hypothetical protein
MNRLIEENVPDVDLAPLAYLGKSCDQSLEAVVNYLQGRHFKQNEVGNTNPLFVVTWQVS